MEAEAGFLPWKKLEADLTSSKADVDVAALGTPNLKLLKLKLEFAISTDAIRE